MRAQILAHSIFIALLAGCAGSGSEPATDLAASRPTAAPSPYSLRVTRPQAAAELRVENDLYAAEFSFVSELGQPHNGIRVSLENRSGESQVLDWDLAKIIDIKGYSSSVTFFPSFAHEPGKADAATQKVRLAPGQTLAQTLYPLRRFLPVEGGNYVAGSLLPVNDESLHGERLGMLLTLDSDNGRHYLSFEFTAQDKRAQ